MQNILFDTNDVLIVNKLLAQQVFKPEITEKKSNNSILASNKGNVFFDKANFKKLNISAIKLGGKKSKLPFFVEPEIINNIIYIYDLGSALYAYDLENKSLLWQRKLADNQEEINLLKGGVTYHKDKLYVTIGNNFLYVIDAKNGDLLWKKNLTFIARSKPFITDNMVYISTINNILSAYNINNQKRIWIKEFTSKNSSQYGSSSFIEQDNVLVTGNSNGDLILLDKDSGKILRQENLGDINPDSESYNFSDIDITPIIHNEDLYAISNSGYISSFKLISGIKNWDLKISANNNRPWLTQDLLFVIDKLNNLIAISTKTGKIKWFNDLSIYGKNNNNFYGPVIANSKVMIVSNLGKILLFDFNNGKLLDKLKIPKNINHKPLIISNKIYLTDNKAKIYIID